MCTGKLIRFFCPEARKENKLCPNYNTTSGVIKDHRKVWMHSEFKCCGRHAGPCVECEDLYEPKNVKVVNAWAVLCDGCGARLRSDIKAIMDAVDATSDSENLSDQRSVIGLRETTASSSGTDCNGLRGAKRRWQRVALG
ncbi:predicted protein [Chaetomium globosum CBS 148.51]|uniref:Uncharacterized protein n=1 Tax=Chaetomium globosum (strain ATCC 6205 / CBS 148.51 / DSM 1962 / NBRC 6347 / NRRL 1970) TaxID=306901 RepID=Q2H8I6_CHAGB|nr:uncharacterized protein CHGG_03468 [Chaetomium globosum CBS 148.51]EAQ91533.1 predicted protein [Chaetomium globosum CBS 148.51]